jgi:hypothetical protein
VTKIVQTGSVRRGAGSAGKLTTFIPIRIRQHGGRKVVVPASPADATAEHDAPMLTALAKAFHWQRLIDEGHVASSAEIARKEGLHPTTVGELLRMTLLSPAVVRAILDGQQPKTLSLFWLKNNALPWGWEEQARVFEGFDGPTRCADHLGKEIDNDPVVA